MRPITTKTQARERFGDQAGIARALGITPQAVHRWPEQLTTRQSNEITGAAIRQNWIRQIRRTPGQAA